MLLWPRSSLLLTLSCAVFCAGLWMAGSSYFASRAFDARDMVISDLVSPDDNPHGYGPGAAGIAVAAFLLVPLLVRSHVRSRAFRAGLALAGTLCWGLGLTAALAIGVLAPLTHDYTPLHVQLAFAAFIGVCAGTTMHLGIAAPGRRGLIGLVCFEMCVLLFLGYLYFHPRFFGNTGLLDSLAFWEWMLCGNCVALLGTVCSIDRE